MGLSRYRASLPPVGSIRGCVLRKALWSPRISGRPARPRGRRLRSSLWPETEPTSGFPAARFGSPDKTSGPLGEARAALLGADGIPFACRLPLAGSAMSPSPCAPSDSRLHAQFDESTSAWRPRGRSGRGRRRSDRSWRRLYHVGKSCKPSGDATSIYSTFAR